MLKGQRLALVSLLIDVICSPYCSCLSWTLGSTHMPVTPGPQHTCHLSTVIFITTSLRNCEDAKEVISISSLCCDFSVVSLQCQPLCLNSEIIIQLPTQLGDTVVKNLPAKAEGARDVGLIPGSGRSLEKEMATHSSTLAWKIPWTEEPGRLQSMGLQKDGHN